MALDPEGKKEARAMSQGEEVMDKERANGRK